MALSSLPDIVGMLVMMGVLAWLRKKYEDEAVDLWLLGLFFILIEAIAVGVFRGSSVFRLLTHVAALDSYVLAGLTFGWAAHQDSLPGKRQLPVILLLTCPLLLVTTLYGLDVTARTPYLYATAIPLALGLAYILYNSLEQTRFRLTLLAMHLAVWTPSLVLACQGRYRWAIYWGLTCLYLLVAFSFRCRVRKGSVGGIVIVTGFVIWALCFLAHPLVRGQVVLDGVVEQIWNLQKFLVILGMLVSLLEDETERRRSEALHDALTGLPNRRLFDDRLAQGLERAMRTGKSTALFLIDLDGFKQINDTFGHQTGDLMLQSAADCLRGKVRSSDTLARCGGDEFCIIINDLSRRHDCEGIALSLESALDKASVPTLAAAKLRGSVGFAMFPEDANDGDALFRLADRRMYERKRQLTRTLARTEDHSNHGNPVLVERQAR